MKRFLSTTYQETRVNVARVLEANQRPNWVQPEIKQKILEELNECPGDIPLLAQRTGIEIHLVSCNAYALIREHKICKQNKMLVIIE